MKKILILLLSFIVLMSCLVASTSAATITSSGGTDVGTAKASFVASPDVYKVDITWGALTYTYTQTWSTSTRKNSYTWASTAAGTADKITIANSSNVGVKASLAWSADTIITGVTGTFGNSSLTLAAPAEGAAAPTANTTLTLGGTPSTTSLSDASVGSITVTITKNP